MKSTDSDGDVEDSDQGPLHNLRARVMQRPAFQKVQSGSRLDSLSAETWNGFIDAALDFRKRQNGNAAALLAQDYNAGIVRIRNDSGADRRRYEVLGIKNDLVILPSTDSNWTEAPCLKGAVPTAASYLRRFVVCQEPIANGDIGRALIAGVTPVKVKILNTADDFCDILDSDATQLVTSCWGAAQILWMDTSGGTGSSKWAYVMHGLPAAQILVGQTSSSLNSGASGTINVYRGTTKGSETFTSGDTITAWNRFANLASGKWVLAAWFQGGWELIAAQC